MLCCDWSACLIHAHVWSMKKEQLSWTYINGIGVVGPLFVLPLHVMSPPSPPPARAERSDWTLRMSSLVGMRRGPSLLTFQEGQTHQANADSLGGVTLPSSAPHPHLLFLSRTPHPLCHPLIHVALNIFTFPDSPAKKKKKHTLTATVRASKWGKCVRRVCDVVFKAPGYTKQAMPVWTDNKKKKNNSYWCGEGVRRDRSFKVRWPPTVAPNWWIILSHEVIVNLSTNASVPLGNTGHFVVAIVVFRTFVSCWFLSQTLKPLLSVPSNKCSNSWWRSPRCGFLFFLHSLYVKSPMSAEDTQEGILPFPAVPGLASSDRTLIF